MKNRTLIYNARLVDRDIDVKNGAVLIAGNKIEGFPSKDAVKKMLADDSVSKFDAKGCVVMPGFIDMHAHFRDPGLTYKEDIKSGSMAAAAGGYTTVVLMPNTKPVVSSMEQAEKNNRKAEEAGFIQTFQSVSITKDFDGKTVNHLDEVDAKKVPLITEDGKEVTDTAVMLKAMKKAAQKKLIVSCHCEDPYLAQESRALRKEALDLMHRNKGKPSASDKNKAVALLKESEELLRMAEDLLTQRNIELARRAGCHLHLCHVSTWKSLYELWNAKQEGVNITAEITPHHIALSGEKAPGIFNIVNPPLRKENDTSLCIEALRNGTADVIATDHAPHSEEDKASGAPGFSGLETAFAVCNTVLVKENGFTLKKISALMSANPAELLGLKDRGLLQEGLRADLVIVDADKAWTVRGEEFASKGKFTPFEGKKLTGEIEATFHNGNLVFQN